VNLREGYSLNSFSELRAVPPDRRSARTAYRVATNNRWYGFVPGSIAADNNDTVIAPNVGSGRWEAMNTTAATNSGGGGSGGTGGTSDLDDLQQQIDWINIDLHAADDGVFDRLSEIDYELNGGEGNRGLNDRVDDLEEGLEDLDGWLGVTRNQVDDLQDEVNDLEYALQVMSEVTIANLNFALQTALQTIANLESRVAALENP
jgi:archaellum component FlaC